MSLIHANADRLHGLDALRGFALLAGVVLHGAMAYLTVPVWPTGDIAAEPVANALFFAIHLFRMTAFFVIAGLFAQMMLDRRRIGGFLKNRLIRIGGPLVVFWGPMLAAIIAVVVWSAALQNGGAVPDGPPPPAPTLQTLPLTHLWFLWVLLIFYVVALILRAPAVLLDRTGAWGRVVDRVTGLLIGPWTPFVLAAPLAFAMWRDPAWIAFFAVPTPDEGLVPDTAALVGFGLAFGLGFLLDRRRDLLARISAWSPMFLVVAVAAGVWSYVLAGGPRLEPMVEPTMDKLLAAGVTALAVYASAFAAMGLCLRLLSDRHPVMRYLADSSYWVYILHLPLVMLAQVWVQDWAGPWWLKLAGVSLGVLAVCLLTYELLVRHGFTGRWLNGRRIPWRRREPEPAAMAAE